MSQNSERLSWTFEEVDSKLKGIMVNIFHNLDEAAKKYSVASIVVGILAPSATAKHPFATKIFASSKFNSFCVAHGSAISHFTDH